MATKYIEARYGDASIGASPDTISPALVSSGINAARPSAPEGEAAGQKGEGGEGGLELFIVESPEAAEGVRFRTPRASCALLAASSAGSRLGLPGRFRAQNTR
ncbi:hypothetical protein L249_4898 [Ophiocordyceps polyrhachis-furcata BCC 54312]|uniref:Uncharacterized protein n=1 Tax=Ophiocordyceps polyrhachis-furcata BCC 54312 TaxID=1330021 RepID=A0A367L2V2_9HYPO|nr:hypothetical protein L249_4898 [Ophiocordyceps polyrhachis-furcata BCC 54312]